MVTSAGLVKRLFLVVAALGIVSVPAHGQTVTGTVVDSATSAAVSNALVKWVETPQCSVRTNASGAFTLTCAASQTISPARSLVTQGNITISREKVSITGLAAFARAAVKIVALDGRQMSYSEKAAGMTGTLEFAGLQRAPGIYLVTVNASGREYHAICTRASTTSFAFTANPPANLAKAAVSKTLQIAANGYVTKNISTDISSSNAGTIKLLKSTTAIGVWTNVTPTDFSADPNFAGTGANYGATVVLANPAKPGILYAFACYQGCWRSTDYGATWVKFNAGNGYFGTNPDGIDIARPVGRSIAPDGSYMIICSIYPMMPPNASPQNLYYNNYNPVVSVFISRENGPDSALGKYWEMSKTPAVDNPIRTAIDPGNKNHILVTVRNNKELLESMDAGLTWHGDGAIMPAGSNELFFVNSNTIIVGTPDDGGSYRGVKVGTTFPWTWTFTKISTQSQGHTMWSIFIDTLTNNMYFPGAGGVDKSSDLTGSSWTRIMSGTGCRSIVATPTRFYIGDEFPTQGTFYFALKHANRSSETVWINETVPAGMTNGPVYCRAVFDGSHYILVSGNWLAGFWRYIEP